MDSNIRFSSGVKTQLLQMLYEFLGFRVSDEYAPSTFQNWYSQIDTFIKEDSY